MAERHCKRVTDRTIHAPITLMIFAIFVRSKLVTTPGWPMVVDMFPVLGGTLGVAFAMFGRIYRGWVVDAALRCLVAALAFGVMFTPDTRISAMLAAVLAPGLVVGIWQHRKIAPSEVFRPVAEAAPAGDLAPVLADAKRDIG